jgi:hypothetical protein
MNMLIDVNGDPRLPVYLEVVEIDVSMSTAKTIPIVINKIDLLLRANIGYKSDLSILIFTNISPGSPMKSITIQCLYVSDF